jgi:hypothetical protein
MTQPRSAQNSCSLRMMDWKVRFSVMDIGCPSQLRMMARGLYR